MQLTQEIEEADVELHLVGLDLADLGPGVREGVGAGDKISQPDLDTAVNKNVLQQFTCLRKLFIYVKYQESKSRKRKKTR